MFGYGEGQFITDRINGRAIEELIFFDAEGRVGIVLLQFLDEGDVSSAGAMLGYFTNDLEAFERRVLDTGGSVFQAIGPLELPGKTTRIAFYSDPEGFVLEVIEE